MEIKTKLCNPANYGRTRGSAEIQWIVIHWTSNEGDTAANNATYFARETLKSPASAHYFVDEKEIWLSVPEHHAAYHVGAKTYKHPKCRNSNSIGIEICMTGKGYVLRKESISNAVRLTRMLMEKHDLDADHVIRHYDVTGKNCPAPMVQDVGLWDSFKAALTAQEDEKMKTYQYIPDMPEWAQDTFARLVRVGVVARDKDGAVNVQEGSLQPMVYLDRLTGGQIEKLPDIVRQLKKEG